MVLARKQIGNEAAEEVTEIALNVQEMVLATVTPLRLDESVSTEVSGGEADSARELR